MPRPEISFRENGRPLSSVLSKIILQAEEDNRQILTPKDFVDFYQVSGSYARKMIAQLVKNGWLIRIGPGMYQLQPAKTGLEPYPTADKFVAAGQISRNGFIAFGSAAEYHGLTTQVFQSVFVATPRRAHVREAPPVRIVYVHLKQDNMVGFQDSSKGPNVQIATIERTLIDTMYRPDFCGGISDIPEIFRRGIPRINVDKILECLPTYHSKSLVQRVGFMLETFGCHLRPKQEHLMQKWCQGNSAYLFGQGHAGTDRQHRYDSKWRLVINASGFSTQEKIV
jgi:predicted transcriptional regulator of viral defense system